MSHLLILRCRFCGERYDVLVGVGLAVYACPVCGTNTPDVLASLPTPDGVRRVAS